MVNYRLTDLQVLLQALRREVPNFEAYEHAPESSAASTALRRSW